MAASSKRCLLGSIGNRRDAGRRVGGRADRRGFDGLGLGPPGRTAMSRMAKSHGHGLGASADLRTLLGLGRSELVAFVGAGGKSSLLLGLGAELSVSGSRVVLTTTTKMGTDQIPGWATVCRTDGAVSAALERGEPAFLVGDIAGEKVTGVAPELVDRLFATATADYLLAEADGARGRPFKAPAPHEPVIPTATTLVDVVAGIDAIGLPIADVAHRPERVTDLTGRLPDDPVRPVDMARVLADPEGGRRGVPAGARVVVVLTKVSPGLGADAAAAVADRLEAEPNIDRVVTIAAVAGPESDTGASDTAVPNSRLHRR